MSLPMSVIMPVYNGSEYLEEAIRSLLSQTFDDFEIVIANDGSTDNTSAIIHDYASQDKRIVFLDRKYNIGIYQTLNQLHLITRGDYITTMSHDDISTPDRLEEIYNYFQQNPNIDVCGNFMKVFGRKEKIKKFPLNHDSIKYIRMPFIGMGTSPLNIKKEVAKKFFYREKYGPAGDMDFLAQILLKSNFRVATIPKILYHFRTHDSNLSYSTTQSVNQLLINLYVLSNIYKIPIDESITHTLKNFKNTNQKTMTRAKNSILEMQHTLDENYSKQIGVDLGYLLKSRFEFLLKAG